jgi:archaemetzincin
MKRLVVFVLAIALLACSKIQESVSNELTPISDPRVQILKNQRDAIVKYYKPMQIQDGDWLESQHEPGQTFEEYIASNPTLPTTDRRTIYIQPIGNFNAEQKRVIRLTAEYMKAFYDLPVTLRSEQAVGNVPIGKQRRVDINQKNRQILTGYFLEDILPNMLPSDGAALIAFTNFDLYPEETWHFVFGQASLEKRVGVWSLYRLSDLDRKKDNAADRLLTRTMKIAMHELGHMFGMRHCTKYECLMSGTNHLAETDRRPLDNCPECMAKIAWAMHYDPAERYKRLAAFWKKTNNSIEEKRMLEMAKAVRVAEKN